MSYPRRLHLLTLFFFLCFFANPATSQSLQLRWTKEFPKEVSWYVRTSPGILVVKAGKSITALDGANGQQLWALPEVKWSGFLSSDIADEFPRGKNMIEVPGLGVLLLNRVMLPGDSEGRLIALNLMTGERLWDQPEADDLLTAVPLYGTREIVLVSRRLQRKAYAKRVTVLAVAAAAAGAVTALLGAEAMTFILRSPYPFRFVFQRLDAVSGKAQWNTEYPHTFNPGSQSLSVIGEQMFINFNNGVFGVVDLKNGNRSWEGRVSGFDINSLPLPGLRPGDRLIYGWKNVEAIDPATRQLSWEIGKLGIITGISECGELVVAIGHKSVAAVDAKTGAERWRKKAYSHTTNILWDKQSDAILYADEKGLHSVDRTTGKSLLDARLDGEFSPYYIRPASPEAVVTIATDQVSAYNFKTGKKLFTAGKFSSFFRSYAFQDHWPVPDDGQELIPRTLNTPGKGAWNSSHEGTLLSANALKRLEGYATENAGLLDAYETQSETGESQVWWIDADTNRQILFRPTGKHHDVSRPMSMVFAVDQKLVWGAVISLK
ncbi:MAG TPA: PQQ-binding-like beta-propeller repeat protein [Candidatus Acidoferrum sp.]|nr:PQQ-binding-like beta-propeller repeat protein [Candidatus Acidoferrum sp.]